MSAPARKKATKDTYSLIYTKKNKYDTFAETPISGNVGDS